MPAPEPFAQLLGMAATQLSHEENLIVEADLFRMVCDELINIFRVGYKNYFYLMRFSTEMEDKMLEENFLRCLVNDILSMEEYSLPGIAYHTQIPEEIIYEIACGMNHNPSLKLARKLIELHRSIRPKLYQEIMNKVITLYLSVA
jgi:hypothetical protein